jgi:hypothetical protein
MPFFAGLRGTGSFGTDERPKNFREMILFLNPNGSAPLYALTSKAKTESVDDPEFNWWEETNDICRLIVNGALDNNPATVTVVVTAGALQLIPGDLLYVEPAVEIATVLDEYLRVVSIASDTSFTVKRAVAGSSIAAIGNGLALLRVGNAQSEGNLSIASSSTNPIKYNNYCQIFKTPYQITKTALATRFRTGDPKKNEQKRKSFQHSEKIEQSLMFGRAQETVDATNGNLPLRYTMGLRQWITSNRKVYTADPTIASFIADVSPVFDFESGSAGNERIVFAGNGAMNFLNQLVKTDSSTRINFDKVVEFYGMRLSRFIMPQGTLYFKTHPLMSRHPVYTNSMFVVNPSGIIYRPLKGRDTKMEKDIQPNDADYIKDQWLTECGFEFHFERTFSYIGGFKDWP